MKPSIKTRLYDRTNKYIYAWNLNVRNEKANSRVWRLPCVQLSKKEQTLFENTWKGCDSDSYSFYKAFGCKLDFDLVPNDYYQWAEHVLNLRWATFFLQHKCNLKYIIPEKNRPKTILQKIDGHYVSEDNTEMSKDEAKKLLEGRDEFICKVAMGTGGGRGVQKICLNKQTDSSLTIEQLLKPEDLIFQEVLSQNEFLASLNPDSVNTFRLLTLNINENCTVLSSLVRMGAKGSFVDNLCSGGGALVGISQDGKLSDFGIRKDYSKCYETPTGIPFKGMQVPDWDYIKKTVVEFHQHIPYANLIGWDITIDKNGELIVIEINLDGAEIEAHQIFNGPVFGARLDEVRKYIEKKKPLLRHAMITY